MDRFNKTIKIQILVVASSNTCQMCRSCRVICNLRSKNVVLQTFEAKKRILACLKPEERKKLMIHKKQNFLSKYI